MGGEPDSAGAADDFDQGTRFVRAREVLWRQLADVVLVRTVAEPEITELSGTGLLLWMALIEPGNAAELAADLAAVVGAPVDSVAGDVRGALADLVRRGLVTPAEAT